MSPAKDNTPFAGDGTLWTDGQAPYRDSLSDSLPDPLSSDLSSSRDDFTPTPVQAAPIPRPPHPDDHSVQETMSSVLLDEEDTMSKADDFDSDFTYPKPYETDPEQPPLGMLPHQQSWPARKVLKPRKTAKSKRPRKKLREQLRQRPTGLIPARKLSTGTVGFIVALVLMIIFGIVAIAMLSSLFSMIGGIFQR